jgi:hypothetical protein
MDEVCFLFYLGFSAAIRRLLRRTLVRFVLYSAKEYSDAMPPL